METEKKLPVPGEDGMKNDKEKEKKKKKKKKRDRGDKDERKSCPKQDPFFYAHDTNALENMASFPWSEVAGASPLFGDFENGGSATVPVKLKLPGIAIVKWLPTFGYQNPSENTDSGSYFDRAASVLFNYIAQGFSSSMPFEDVDMEMYNIAAHGLTVIFEEGKRAYGLMKYWLQYNKFFAKEMVEALGFSYSDLNSRLADFRTQYNIRVEQFNKMVKAPKAMMLGERWRWMTSTIWADNEDDEKRQIIAYVPQGYPRFDSTTMATGTCLILQQRPAKFSVDEYFAAVDKLLNALDGDDPRSIAGMMNRVYGEESFLKAIPLEDGYVTGVSYHDVTLNQLNNAEILTGAKFLVRNELLTYPKDSQSDLIESNVMLYQDARSRFVSQICSSDHNTVKFLGNPERKHFINVSESGKVTAAVAIDATNNLLPVAEIASLEGGESAVVVAPRADVITSISLYYFSGANTVASDSMVQFLDVRNYVLDSREIKTAIKSTNIKYMPKTFIIDVEAGESLPIGEIHNYILLNQRLIQKLNDRTWYQLLALPAATKSITK